MQRQRSVAVLLFISFYYVTDAKFNIMTKFKSPLVTTEESSFATEEETPVTREKESLIVTDEQSPQTFAGEDVALSLAGEEEPRIPQQEMIMGKNSAQQESDNNSLPEESYILPTAQDGFINESSTQQESGNNLIVEEGYVSSSAAMPDPHYKVIAQTASNIELTEEELMTISEKPSSAPSSAPSDKPTTGQPTTGQPTTSQPTTGQPTTSQPTTGQPSSAPSDKPTTSNIYGNKKSKIGPWPECVGWHDEDCVNYIESEVEDTIQFAVNKPKTYTVHRIYVAVDEYNVVWNTPCRG